MTYQKLLNCYDKNMKFERQPYEGWKWTCHKVCGTPCYEKVHFILHLYTRRHIITCLFHKWNGCMCEQCGKTRDKQHIYKHNIDKCEDECKLCGAKSSVRHHSWNGCVCEICGDTRHEMIEEWGGFKTSCSNCDYVDEDEVRRAIEWSYL